MQVRAWNGWDPLRRVVVGRADGTMVQAPEPAVRRDWPDHGFPFGSSGPLPAELTAAANVQLDDFAGLLESRGVVVDRPEPLAFDRPISTPDWRQETMFGCLPVRDVLITVGNEILESTMSYRSRWFEYLCYRPLLEAYFASDPGMRWEAAPKPRLTDRSFRPGFWDYYPSLPKVEQIARVRRNELLLTETEPLFDAADIARFGKDLFVQLSLSTNRAGYRWIKQHFRDHRVHAVTFDNPHPQHIDATFVPLRPGLVLHCGERPAEPELVGYFRRNDWRIVPAAPPVRTPAELPPYCYCSPWLAINLLSLDETTVCVEESEVHVAHQLSTLGFEVVPVKFWDVAPFGGGLHCATLDVHRDGELVDYFRHRHGRF